MTPLILHGKFVLPMTAGNPLIEDGAILVGADGRIEQVGDATSVLAAHPGVPVKRCDNALLMPGLINTHAHSGLLRGTAEGLPVWEWLEQFIDPMHRVLQPHEAALASLLCYAEALLSGTTTIVDMWRFMHGSARAAEQLGIRAVLVPYVAEHPDHDYFETLDTNEALIQEWHGGARRPHQRLGRPGAHVLRVAGRWARALALGRKHQVGFHTHSNESHFDVDETQRRYGKRPVEALEHFGLLDAQRVLLAHCVWLADHEIELLAQHGVGVAHNPVSNMKLASGAAPVEKMLAQRHRRGPGHGWRKGEQQPRHVRGNEGRLAAGQVHQAGRRRPRFLGRLPHGDDHGRPRAGPGRLHRPLEAGKQADMIAIRTDTPRMTPLLTGGWQPAPQPGACGSGRRRAHDHGRRPDRRGRGPAADRRSGRCHRRSERDGARAVPAA